jgi:hypothetical protein
MKRPLSVLLLLICFSLSIYAAGEIEDTPAIRAALPKNPPEVTELNGEHYRVVNYDPDKFAFDIKKGNIKKGENLYLDGFVYQVHETIKIGVGLPSVTWYGVWWELTDYAKVSEGDHVRVWGVSNLTYNTISEAMIGSVNIKKLEVVKKE